MKLKELEVGQVFTLAHDPIWYARIYSSSSYNCLKTKTFDPYYIHPDTSVRVIGQLVVIPLEDVKQKEK